MSGEWVRASAVVGLLVGFGILLTSCSTGGAPVESTLTVSDAKTQTQSVEDEIVALVPQEYIASVRRVDPGLLMSCSAKDAVMWTGGVSITVKGQPDFSLILKGIQDSFDKKASFKTQMTTSDGETPELDIKSDDNGVWLVNPISHNTVLHITSASPCFPTPDGLHGGSEY